MRERQLKLYALLAVNSGVLVSFGATKFLCKQWGSGNTCLYVNEPLHSSVEAVGGMMAILVAVFLLLKQKESYSGKRFLFACGFLGMGILDIAHSFTVPGHGFVFLRSMASFTGSVWFAFACVPALSSDSDAPWKKKGYYATIVFSFFIIFLAVFFSDKLPRFSVEGRFSPVAVWVNFVAGILYAGSAVRFLFHFFKSADYETYYIVCVSLLFSFACFSMPLYSLWDYAWWMWHAARFFACGVVLMFAYSEYQKMIFAMRHQLLRTDLLNNIARSIIIRMDLKSMFRSVASQVEEGLPADMASVWLYDSVKNAFILFAFGARTEDLFDRLGMKENDVISISETNVRESTEGKSLYIADITALTTPYALKWAGAGLRSGIVSPIAVDGSVFAILSVCRKSTEGFSRDEMKFMNALAEHLSVAVKQMRLFENLKSAYDDLHNTHKALMQQERMKALGQMASGIAHDMNNALSPVAGFAELLLDDEPGLSDRTRTYLNHIIVSAKDAAHIVSRMREFYRPREEQDETLPVDVGKLLRGVAQLTRPRWYDIPHQKGVSVSLKMDIQGDLPVVIGNESEMREALTNLIFNAVDALPEGGEIIVNAYSNVHVFVEVRDNGVGMSEDDRARCLEPFFTTKGGQGTGMGLSMVYGVMQRHEGSMEIESEKGKGTAVRLIFPVRKNEEDKSKTLPERKAPVLRPLRVLCVDDAPMVRELLKEILIMEEHLVETAEGGAEGLAAFRRARADGKPFDVVVTDLGMPHVGGKEVAQTVKNESPETAVILLTGWGQHAKADGEVTRHVDVVLGKPPNKNELLAALARVTKNDK